jgi:hypothetical protein
LSHRTESYRNLRVLPRRVTSTPLPNGNLQLLAPSCVIFCALFRLLGTRCNAVHRCHDAIVANMELLHGRCLHAYGHRLRNTVETEPNLVVNMACQLTKPEITILVAEKRLATYAIAKGHRIRITSWTNSVSSSCAAVSRATVFQPLQLSWGQLNLPKRV